MFKILNSNRQVAGTIDLHFYYKIFFRNLKYDFNKKNFKSGICIFF